MVLDESTDKARDMQTVRTSVPYLPPEYSVLFLLDQVKLHVIV